MYDAKTELFPQGVRDLLREEALYMSPMVDLELQYLHEIERLRVGSSAILAHLESALGLTVPDTPFSRVKESQAVALLEQALATLRGGDTPVASVTQLELQRSKLVNYPPEVRPNIECMPVLGDQSGRFTRTLAEAHRSRRLGQCNSRVAIVSTDPLAPSKGREAPTENSTGRCV